MKVVIELLGTESKEDLLATSNYLRELAGETTPVADATKAKGEEACLPLLMEAERAKSAKTRASRAKKVEAPEPDPEEEVSEPDPEEEVSAPDPEEEVSAPAPAPAPAQKAPAAPVEKPSKDETVHTVDECKQWAMKALNAKKRPLVQEAFEQVGATSFPTLKESMFAEFIEYISTRL